MMYFLRVFGPWILQIEVAALTDSTAAIVSDVILSTSGVRTAVPNISDSSFEISFDPTFVHVKAIVMEIENCGYKAQAVSYTHLTLPTILLV